MGDRALEELRTVVEMVPTATLAVRSDGLIVLANAAAHALFEVGRGALEGANVDALVAGASRAPHADHRAMFLERPEARQMQSRRGIYAQRPNGATFPVDVGLNPVTIGGETLTLAAIVDITAQRTAQRRAELLEERLALRAELDAMALTLPEDELLSGCLKASRLSLRSRFGMIGRLDANGDFVCAARADELAEAGLGIPGGPVIPESDWPAALRRVLSSNEVVIDNACHEAEHRFVGVAIRPREASTAAIFVAGRPDDYDLEDEATLRLVASFLDLVLSRPIYE